MDDTLLERLGDCRRIADALGAGVGALATGVGPGEAQRLIAHGADQVLYTSARPGGQACAAAAARRIGACAARLVMAGGEGGGREWAARLAVRLGCALVSPALMVKEAGGRLEVTRLDATGRMARSVCIEAHESVVVTLRAGVGEAVAADSSRTGELMEIAAVESSPAVRRLRLVPADPATGDIRHAARLVAGGRGVGGREGFNRLREFAAKIGAGVAASRMAVDLGWIERERQVGQTGKTVSPELYIACGISGASHHLDGMSAARHIVAINTDPQAPIFKVAHLGLAADLHDLLERAGAGLAAP